MGADLIRYHAFVPLKAADKLLEAHLTKLDKALALIGGPDKIADGGLDPKVAALAIKALETAGARVQDFDDLATAEALQSFVADIELVRNFDPAQFNYRDSASATVKINGVDMAMLFAGELSWGDEPQGAGYTALRALYRTGLIDVLYDAVPWDARRAKR